MNLQGKHVLVVGSVTPWVEELILALGALHVVTLEYRPIESDHEQVILFQAVISLGKFSCQLSSYVPYEFMKAYLNGSLEEFDAIVSFSSLEHSGLGRYGDSFNPWGDRIAMAQIWCTLKKNGLALIGIPLKDSDRILFNGSREYGPIMLPHIFANFKVLWTSHPRLEYFIGKNYSTGVILGQAIK